MNIYNPNKILNNNFSGNNIISPKLDLIKANLLMNSDNQVMLKNKIIHRNDYSKLNNEDKWKQDKYNIENDYQIKGNNKDYLSVKIIFNSQKKI